MFSILELVALLGTLPALVMVAEFVLYQRLDARLLLLEARLLLPTRNIPEPGDPERLAGFAGETEHVAYRWDPERRALFFKRRFKVGRRAYAMGIFRFPEGRAPELRWAPWPISFYPLVALIALAHGGWLLHREAPLEQLLLPALLFAGLQPVAWLNTQLSKRFLVLTMLPELVETLEAHLADAPPEPA